MEGNKRKRNQNSRRKKKVEIVFDPEARREFLTGFHKRKVERKLKFQEDLKKQMRQEQKRIKSEAKESYKTMVKSHQTIPEVEHLLKEEHDLGSHSVEIVELSSKELALQNNWIGTNEASWAKDEPSSEDENEEATAEPESEIPGMDLKRKPPVKVEKPPKPKPESVNITHFKTSKDVKNVIRKEATSKVKKSKVFQLQNKIEKMKSRKKAAQLTKRRSKAKAGGKKGKRAKRVKAANKAKYG